MAHASGRRKTTLGECRRARGGCLSGSGVIGLSALARALMASLLSGDLAVRLAPPLFVFLWATGFVVARLVAPWADPLTFLSLRFVIAAACLALIALAVRAPGRPRRRRGAMAWSPASCSMGFISGRCSAPSSRACRPDLGAARRAAAFGHRDAGRAAARRGGLAAALARHRARFLGGASGHRAKTRRRDGFAPITVLVSLLGTVSITLGTIWQKRTAAGVDLRTNAVAQFLGARSSSRRSR
jgi:drug/metabolite transporter (DMT)-like permease